MNFWCQFSRSRHIGGMLGFVLFMLAPLAHPQDTITAVVVYTDAAKEEIESDFFVDRPLSKQHSGVF